MCVYACEPLKTIKRVSYLPPRLHSHYILKWPKSDFFVSPNDSDLVFSYQIWAKCSPRSRSHPINGYWAVGLFFLLLIVISKLFKYKKLILLFWQLWEYYHHHLDWREAHTPTSIWTWETPDMTESVNESLSSYFGVMGEAALRLV